MNLKQKIRKLNENKYFKTPKMERLLNILMFVAVYEETNIETISGYLNLSPALIKKYLSDKDLIMTILDEEEYKELIKIIKNIDLVSEKEKYIEKVKITSKIIDDILTTRYRIDEIARKNFLSPYTLRKYLDDKEFLSKNFGENTYELIEKRIEETSKLRDSVKGSADKILVQDKNNLAILKDDIHYLTEYEYRTVDIVSTYLFSECNVDEMAKNGGISYQNVLIALNDENLKRLLKEDYYKRVVYLRELEKNFNQIGIQNKRDLLVSCVEALINNNYNTRHTANQTKIPYYLLKRIIEQDFISMLYDKEIIQKIDNAFNPNKELEKGKTK